VVLKHSFRADEIAADFGARGDIAGILGADVDIPAFLYKSTRYAAGQDVDWPLG
jgi:hypothetical protein